MRLYGVVEPRWRMREYRVNESRQPLISMLVIPRRTRPGGLWLPISLEDSSDSPGSSHPFDPAWP